MVENFINKSRKLLNHPQNSVLSAATLIMFMLVASMLLGLIRQRVLVNYFTPEDLSLFFAAFRLPDSIFQVLVFGTFSSAFIPVFTRALKKGDGEAWEIAGRVVTIGLGIFIPFAVLLAVFANQIYSLLAPGFGAVQTQQIANLARILFAAQGFFVVSYVLTGVLESQRRFLVPALAPIFYNLGIILGTIFLTPYVGLIAPAIGVVIGASAHFLIQYPLSRKLGFRFIFNFHPNEGVKKIGNLALPRIIDLAFDQIGKTVELFLSSLISQGSYAFYTIANTLQLLPVTLFGTSLAKAVLPLLSRHEDDNVKFRKILLIAIFQALFLSLPLAAVLIVLRIPIVRLVYGTKIFDWNATVQTGQVLSVYALGIATQILMSVLARAFFALHDTKTPVKVSFVGLALLVTGDFILVRVLHLEVWALAASFSFSTLIEAILLLYLINKRVGHVLNGQFFVRCLKILSATLISGGVMYLILKVFDKSVWVKRISFLGKFDASTYLSFERLVLDTRYTANLFILTTLVFIIGMATYLIMCVIFKIDEIKYFFSIAKGLLFRKMTISFKEEENPDTPPTDVAS